MEGTYKNFLTNLHTRVQQRVKQNDHERNYIRLFRPYNPHKVNVMGTFADAIAAENGAVPVFCPASRKAFGMVATEQFFTYSRLVPQADSVFADAARFKAYVDENYTHFCVDPDESTRAPQAKQETWQKAFYARCILAAARACCFALHFAQAQDAARALAILAQDAACTVVQDKADKTQLFVYGRPLENSLAALHGLFVSVRQGELWVAGNAEGGQPFAQLYTETYATFYKSRGHALYSGTIPRLLSLTYQKPSMSNTEIEKLLLHTGRTSYLTMYGMGQTAILNHPFMQTCMEEGRTLADWNVLFDANEVAVQETYFAHMQSADGCFEAEVAALNEYLCHSWNVHNINISGNLITADDYCLYTKRGNFIEDAGHYYCSVNGGSEIKDDNVDFYDASVEEDIPTIHYENTPYYFGGELTREAVGELGIVDTSRTWNYYGITAMGHTKSPQDTQRIWLHFNVMGVRNCMDTFDKIATQKNRAAESFENSALLGYRLHIFANQKARALYYGKSILAFLVNQKDLIMLLLLFILYTANGQSFFNFDNILSGIFVLMMAVSLAGEFYAYRQDRKYKKHINIIANKACIPYEWYLRMFPVESQSKLDAVFLYLTALRLDNIFYS